MLTPVSLKTAPLSPTRLPARGPAGAPSTGPRPASSTPRTHGSLRHTAGTGELRRQRPVLSLSSSLRSMLPLRQPTVVENTSDTGPSSRFPRKLQRLLMLTNQLAGPAPDAPSGVVVYARAAGAAGLLFSPGNCSFRGLSPRAWFVIEGGQGRFASSAPLLLEPDPQ